MSGLEFALAAAALLIGATGTWSPCGFSMVETIGPTGHTGGRRTTLAACAAFVPGALMGAVATFGTLGVAGGFLHGAGARGAYLAAAAIALAAAALEARGTRIIPQVRRQLPEHWRRSMPMPVAAALYGVLLGLGFTTFVLTFGVWALAGISLALGDPWLGVLVGLAFGCGRALPIVVLAPLAGSAAGARVTELMATRPGIYRGARLGDALALGVAAVALAGSSHALGAQTAVVRGADPAAEGRDLAFQMRDGTGVLRREAARIELPGRDPALGGPYVTVHDAERIELLDRGSLESVGRFSAPDTDAIAVTGKWMAWRTRREGRDALHARRIDDPQDPGAKHLVASVGRGKQLSIPSVDRGRIAYAVASRRKNRIVREQLGPGGGGTVASSRQAALTTPSLLGDHLAYVKISERRQRLVLKRLGGEPRTLYARGRTDGVLWSTALTADRAFVTLIKGSRYKILSTGR